MILQFTFYGYRPQYSSLQNQLYISAVNESMVMELVLPECKGRGSGGEQYKQVVGVLVHCIRLVALERRAVETIRTPSSPHM